MVPQYVSEGGVVLHGERPRHPVVPVGSAETPIRGVAVSGEVGGEAPQYLRLPIESAREVKPPFNVLPEAPGQADKIVGASNTVYTVIQSSAEGPAAPHDLTAVSQKPPQPLKVLPGHLASAPGIAQDPYEAV